MGKKRAICTKGKGNSLAKLDQLIKLNRDTYEKCIDRLFQQCKKFQKERTQYLNNFDQKNGSIKQLTHKIKQITVRLKEELLRSA